MRELAEIALFLAAFAAIVAGMRRLGFGRGEDGA